MSRVDAANVSRGQVRVRQGQPRVPGGFQLLFEKLDQRIADVIEDGIDRCAYLQRVTLPRLVEGGGLVAPVRERFVPVDRGANPELIETVRGRLRPRPADIQLTPGPTRAGSSPRTWCNG